jgi:16S rRNA (cytosine1402-N4)-methyltransferase
VNGELDELRVFLERITDRLAPGGRLAVISYHSLEDRLVKNAIRDRSGRCVCPPLQPMCTCGMRATLKRVSHKAIQPSEAEVITNRRSRSARLRIAERIA